MIELKDLGHKLIHDNSLVEVVFCRERGGDWSFNGSSAESTMI